ncbi:ANK REP REGION domain-containing protein [Citrus sinensis]|uniref:ANK REP REGION domain-containing protein n=1 Tax=Citrus sinensis TaxID=2711 RepID=A0ACB8NZ13_CITSI|nr:ANK REP REGION domain-containing protein [Citrus sinensis]
MDPYGMALKGDCRGFLQYFAQRTAKDLLDYRTVNGDRAIHIAAAMEDPQLIQEFLESLTSETRLEVLKQTDAFGNNGLHEAAIVENFDVARTLIDFSRQSGDAYKNLLEATNGLGETPVYRAAALGKTKLLQIWTEQVGDLRHHFRRNDGKTVLHMAVLGQHFDTAIWLLKHHSSLANKLTSDGPDGLTCLQLLALMPSAFKSYSKTAEIWTSLVSSCLPTYDDDDCVDYNYKEDLETGKIDNCVACRKRTRGRPAIKKIWMKKQMHKNANKLLKKLVKEETLCLGDGEQNPESSSTSLPNPEISSSNPESSTSSLPNPEIFSPDPESSTTSPANISTISLGLGKGNMLKAKKLVDFSAGELDELLLKKDCTNKGNMIKAKKFVDFSAAELVELFVKKDCTIKGVPNHKKDKNWAIRLTLLFAASNGITEILKEIIHQHPQAILLDNLNEKEQNILHVAVKRRQYKVFELITKEMQLSVPKWASRIDKKGYTLLHHVADMKHYKEGTRPGPVLQFQEELQLFEHVKEIMPRHYAMHRDEKNKMTASDLFNLTHEDQLRKAQEWIKETSQACSVLAILIATVVFTAAFTIPGGNNEKGFPHFLKSPLFYVFTVMDVASLALSLSSVVMFLSILTSPRESSDFLRELPRKLMVGFTLLFFSVLTSMITFSASLLLIIRMEKKWTAALYAAAIFPVIVLALMEFPYCADFLANGKVYYLEFMNNFPWKKKKKKKYTRYF